MDIAKDVNFAINGDEKAIERLYNNTYQKLRAVTVSILKNEDDAEEIIQETYIKAFSSLNQLNDASRFEGWVCRIASNKCKDYLKKKKPVLFTDINNEDSEPFEWSIEDESKEYNPEEIVVSEDTRNQIMELLNSLPDEQRICLVYYAVDEMKISEIADFLEVSESTVKSRIRYAEAKMKGKIEELEKKGIKIRSFAGFALFPFLRYLFSTEAKAAPSIVSSTILESVKKTSKNIASESVGSAISDAGVQTAKTVVGNVFKKIGIKGAISGITGKVVAGVLAVATIASVMTAVVKNNNPSSVVETNIENHLDELTSQELTKLNEYLTFFSEQSFLEYPCSDDELYDFAYIYNKINTNNVKVSTTERFEYAYSIEKNIIDTTLQGFFDRSVAVKDNEYRVLENDIYYQPAADGEEYNNFSIATSLQIINNEYTVAFDTYERQYDFDSETLSEISKRQYVGSGYMVLQKHTNGHYKIVKYVGNNFSETEVYKLYEELLSKGKTENGLEITHYAFVNLDNDRILELLVSNGNGTPDSMSECELYTIKDDKVYTCAQFGSYYDYIYLINDAMYILGCSRKGNEFVSTNEKIKLASSVWDETLGKSQPAISRNDGKWEFITDEELYYYHATPDDGIEERFIQSAEIINLNENTFSKHDVNEDYSEWNGRYLGRYEVGQWRATISNMTENSMNLTFVQSESDCFIEDMILYKQEDGSYYGVGETLYGKANIEISLESPGCICLSATGFVNQMGMEYLYKEK